MISLTYYNVSEELLEKAICLQLQARNKRIQIEL